MKEEKEEAWPVSRQSSEWLRRLCSLDCEGPPIAPLFIYSFCFSIQGLLQVNAVTNYSIMFAEASLASLRWLQTLVAALLALGQTCEKMVFACFGIFCHRDPKISLGR